MAAESYSFGRFLTTAIQHPDPEVRDLARMIDYNAWPHSDCTDAFNQRTGIDEHDGIIWSAGPTAFKDAERCTARGSRPYYLWASGNSTEYFPESIVMCLIPECTREFLSEYYVPYSVAGVMMKQPGARPSIASLREALRVARVRVDEVVTFPAEGLPSPDFVVVGFPLSGSSSLGAELSRHPQIAMPHHEDDVFWTSLLTRRALRKWARPYFQTAERKRRELPANSSGRILLGLKEPIMAFHTATMQQLSRLRELKVIVLVRDPLAMIQSWINHDGDWLNHHGEELGYWVGLLYRHLQERVFSNVASERVLLVPTAALDLAPALAYKRVLDFLGLPPAPAAMRGGAEPLKERHNVWDSTNCRLFGRCLDLCRLPQLRALMKAVFRADTQRIRLLLRERGWPRELQGLNQHCVEGGPQVKYSLCHFPGMPFAPGQCFKDFTACSRCCDQQEDGCDPTGPRWSQCCLWRQSIAMTDLRNGLRRELCGQGRSATMPCCTGRGRSRYLNVP